VTRAAQWWLGDWINYGHARYGERYRRTATLTGYDPQSLMNMAYVASRVPTSRRRENLSWSHHAELAPLGAEEQEYWLERAILDRMSVHCLRSELRLARQRTEGRSSDVAAPRATIQCPHCGHEFTRAERDHRTRVESQWRKAEHE